VEDCGPDTKRPRQVCCMETNATLNNVTILNGINVNRTDGQRRIETIETHFKNIRIMKERQTTRRNVTEILYEHLMGETEGCKVEANDKALKSTDQMKTKIMESKLRAGILTDNVEKRHNKPVFETQRKTTGTAQKKSSE